MPATRASKWIALTLACLVSPAFAKDSKPILPQYILNARTVAILIDPNAGISLRPQRQPDRAARRRGRGPEVGPLRSRHQPRRRGPHHRSTPRPRQTRRRHHQRSPPNQPPRLRHANPRRHHHRRAAWNAAARHARHARSSGRQQHRRPASRNRQHRRLLPGLRRQE